MVIDLFDCPAELSNSEVNRVSNITVSSVSGLTQALKVAQAGDTISLQSGVYSGVSISNFNVGGDVNIVSSDPGRPAVLTDLTLNGSTGLNFANLEFSAAGATTDNRFQVLGSKDIHFDNLSVHGSLNGNAADDVAGFLIRNSADVSITNSEFQQLFHGIGVLDSQKIVISGNDFHDIRSDGIRGGGLNDAKITDNSFKDFYPQGAVGTSGDHPDAIQLWTTNTVGSNNVLISGNLIARGAGHQMQGVFLRDESGANAFTNITITDNVLVGTSWNGIFVENGKNVNIDGNSLGAYGDEGTRILVLDVSGGAVTDNKAASYVYEGNSSLTQSNNAVSAVVSDQGKALIAAWNALHDGDGGGVGSPPVTPPVVTPPVVTPPVTLPDGGAVTYDRTFTGTSRADTLNGTAGKDLMLGGGGDDTLSGAGGDDRLEGGAGNDLLIGGDGSNVLLGGAGDDTYRITSTSDVIVEGANEGYDTVYAYNSFTLSDNVEELRLTSGTTGVGNAQANLISGNSGDNVLKGLGGDDRLEGGAGNDNLDGGVGNDQLYAGTGNDVLNGGDGADTLYGEDGADTLAGGAGADHLSGGAGADVMAGGAGADSFIFRPGDTTPNGKVVDEIVDFSRADGDKVHLSMLDANASVAGDQAFKFIGTEGFHRTAGELRYDVKSDGAYVMGDTNGDGTADFVIKLTGIKALAATDFYL